MTHATSSKQTHTTSTCFGWFKYLEHTNSHYEHLFWLVQVPGANNLILLSICFGCFRDLEHGHALHGLVQQGEAARGRRSVRHEQCSSALPQ